MSSHRWPDLGHNGLVRRNKPTTTAPAPPMDGQSDFSPRDPRSTARQGEETAPPVEVGCSCDPLRGIEEIYGRHGGAVHALATQFCEPSRAVDITVGVFTRLRSTPAAATSPEPTSQQASLLAAAHAGAVAVLRADPRRRAWLAQATPAVVEQESLARAGELTRRILSEIPPLERQAVTLCYFGGLTYRAVAVLIDQPEEAVRRYIATGLAHLHTLAGAQQRPGAEPPANPP